MSPVDPPTGALVEVPPGRGIVKFSGTTSFAPGKWIGIELFEPNGKNDGSVQGIQYFQCKMSYGVFVRTSQVKIISNEAEVQKPSPSASIKSSQPISRPSFGHQRTPSAGLARTVSISNRSTSPVKPSVNLTASPNVTPRSRFAAPPSPVKRPSFSYQPRKSTLQPPVPDTTPVQESLLDEPLPSSNLNVIKTSPVVSTNTAASLLGIDRAESPQTSSILPPPVLPSPPSPALSERDNLRAQVDQEIQELRAKIRVLEARRADDARNIEKLEIQLTEANSFVALRPKLQAKLNSLQQELVSTKRSLSDAEQLSNLSEGRLLDAQEQLEMAMLDKEVAEERAEELQIEIETLQERLASSEVELSTIRDGSMFDPNDSPEKLFLAYAQLERHNERLKEALIKLRDVSHEAETEHRHRLSELERELTGVEELHSQYEATLIKLSNAEAQIDDLKIQLDDALGAEEMLVQLTERNLLLGEKIEEMRITIEDLEALKELNDELEENHVETEKIMQEEVDQKEAQVREQMQKIEDLQYACQDNENTINQFREMVAGLNIELETQRAENQAAQSESATAASQTAAMMSMNLRLQSSFSKTQARNIDLELIKLEAREYKELVDILHPYLPQVYVDSDSTATNCYLLFQRLARKLDLINQVVAQIHRLPDSLNGSVTEQLIFLCEMRAGISVLSIICRRYAAVLKRCDPEVFLTLGRVYFDVLPWEKRVDLHIDLLRREEFRGSECVADIDKLTSQLNDIAGHFNGYDYDIGERQLSYTMSSENDLDTISAALAAAKTAIESILNDDDVEVKVGDLDINEAFFDPLQHLFDQCKGAKLMPKKLTRRLEELISESSALKPELILRFQAMSKPILALSDFALHLAQRIFTFVGEIRSNKPLFDFEELLLLVQNISKTTIQEDNPWTSADSLVQSIVLSASALFPLMMESENSFKVNRIAPWIIRIDEVKNFLAVNVEAESKIVQLTEEIQGLVRGIKARDKNVQEADLKIEMMTRRMETVKKQADTISDLENELLKARQQEREYEEAIEHFQTEVYTLEQDNSKLKSLANNQERTVVGPQPVEQENPAIENNYETSYLLEQIDALRGAVRFLRQENSYLKGQDLLREIQALPSLPVPGKLPPTPPLEMSHMSSDSSDSDEPYDVQRPPTFQTLSTETKMLYRDVIHFSSSPRVVDLSVLNNKRDASSRGVKAWIPRKQTPGHQLLERQLEAEQLNRRVKRLLEKTNTLYGQR